MIADDVLGLVGRTPMIRLRPAEGEWELLIKLEKWNPGGSIKDRAALNMVIQAEADGRLRPGGTIIESSSGNTAIGLAMIAAVRGYRFIAILDPDTPSEVAKLLHAYGAEVVDLETPPTMGFGPAMGLREKYAGDLAKSMPNAVYIEQHNNPANTAAYPETLAREILDDAPNMSLFFGAVGTTGSICGTALGLRRAGHRCKVIAVEPQGSIFFGGEGGPYLQTGAGNPPGIEIPHIWDRDLVDEGLQVSDTDAFATCRALARKFGLLLGGSAGAVLFAANRYVRQLSGSGTAVLLAADGGEPYVSTIYDSEWMLRHGVLNEKLEERIASSFRSTRGDDTIP